MKILISGGGTGGHLYPALAIAESVKREQQATEILFVGANRGLEAKEVPQAGFEFKGLDSVGFPKRPSFRSVRAGWSLLKAVWAAKQILNDFKPDVIFSTGGYASAPVVTAGKLAKIPIVLQEQNSIPGRTNRIASRLATEVHLAYSSARVHFPKRSHLRLSGNPLRDQVLAGSRGRALRQFRLEDDRQTILVLGGSQGAHSINETVVNALEHFDDRDDVQFLIQSGARDHEWVVEHCRARNVKTWVRRFIPNMGDAYELADLVICRAGAMTLAEISACGIPSIVIPYPYAMNDHQRHNAEQLADVEAAILILDADLEPTDLAARIDGLLAEPIRLREMSAHALSLARPHATELITTALLRYDPERVVAPPEEESQRSTGAGRGDRRGGGRGRSGSGSRRGSGDRADGRGDRRSDASRGERSGGGRKGRSGRGGGRRSDARRDGAASAGAGAGRVGSDRSQDSGGDSGRSGGRRRRRPRRSETRAGGGGGSSE